MSYNTHTAKLTHCSAVERQHWQAACRKNSRKPWRRCQKQLPLSNRVGKRLKHVIRCLPSRLLKNKTTSYNNTCTCIRLLTIGAVDMKRKNCVFSTPPSDVGAQNVTWRTLLFPVQVPNFVSCTTFHKIGAQTQIRKFVSSSPFPPIDRSQERYAEQCFQHPSL